MNNPDKLTIIGLGGRAGSGKSTAALFFRQLGFREMTLADPLKEAAKILFSLNQEQLDGAMKEQVDTRLGLAPREIMQRLGDACRGIYPEVFVADLRRRLFRARQPVVVSDVRFRNEARALHLLGAVLIRLERPNLQAAGLAGHASEHELDGWEGWDRIIRNDGSRNGLYRQLGYFLRDHGVEPFCRAVREPYAAGP